MEKPNHQSVTLLGSLWSELRAFIDTPFVYLPGRTGSLLRRFWFGRRFQSHGRFSCGTGCEFHSPQTMSFEGTVWIGRNAFFTAAGGSIRVGHHTAFNTGVHINASMGGAIVIGKYCAIGPNVVMRTANHRFDDVSMLIQESGHEPADICIGDDVWIGANAVILGGTNIGKGAVIGAGAVVTKDIPSNAIAAGVPAKVLRYRGRKATTK